MKILWILALLLMIPLVSGLRDCVTVNPLTAKDLPCQLITPYPYEQDCNVTTAKIYNSTPALIGQTNLTDYIDVCNMTFNLSFNKTGDYFVNFSSGDSVRVSVEVDEKMIIAIAIMLSVFFVVFVGLGFFLFFRRQQSGD